MMMKGLRCTRWETKKSRKGLMGRNETERTTSQVKSRQDNDNDKTREGDGRWMMDDVDGTTHAT